MRHPHVLQLILDSLRYWVTDMHVDGFRFDLATALARQFFEVDQLSALFDLIQCDPVVSQVKLIAEPWDLGPGGYQVGNFPLYQHNGRRPYASVNFVTAHAGFTLIDLVSYNSKHNEANGEDNRSWNCGVEGPTDDPEVLALRARHPIFRRRRFFQGRPIGAVSSPTSAGSAPTASK